MLKIYLVLLSAIVGIYTRLQSAITAALIQAEPFKQVIFTERMPRIFKADNGYAMPRLSIYIK